MGYHVVIDPEDFPIKYTYVERVEDLVKVEGISGKSIIFQGAADSPPQQVGCSADFQRLSEDWYRAGLRAQVVFAKLARVKGWILETLSQDRESFKAYAQSIEGPLKRGDFLIRNMGNTEVEVKCRSFYGKGNQKYFLFSEDDLERHLNMERATLTSVILAVFQRKDDQPRENTLCMIKIDRIKELAEHLVREEKEYGWVYQIPLRETTPGFRLLADYKQGEQEEPADFLRSGYTFYGEVVDTPYVLVAYYRNSEHLNWIVNNGLYNLRMGTDRGALYLGKEEASARYILLHTKGEMRTGKLFQILEKGPRVFSKDLLIQKKYPGIPAHNLYLVYRVTPVLTRELQDKIWDISKLPGFIAGHGSAYPFTVPLSVLLKSYE